MFAVENISKQEDGFAYSHFIGRAVIYHYNILIISLPLVLSRHHVHQQCTVQPVTNLLIEVATNNASFMQISIFNLIKFSAIEAVKII